MPGEKAVDDNILRVAKLWSAPLRPLPSDALTLELAPFHHAAGEQVEAIVDFTYTLRWGDSEVICSSSTNTTLVNKEAMRQDLWDISVDIPAGHPKWLALYSPKIGIIRAIFDGPAEANSFLSWMRTTGTNTAGQFSLGLVDGTSSDSQTDSVDSSIPSSFLALTAENMSTLRVSPIGEP